MRRIARRHTCSLHRVETVFANLTTETTGSGGAQASRISVTQLAVFILAARSASTIKSRVIGTAPRSIDSSI
jgi:hypothetical protein